MSGRTCADRPALTQAVLMRAKNVKRVIEAGTSFGVSTIWLALAVSSASFHSFGPHGRVIATENEPSKAARARQHWARLPSSITSCIDLREGDILETLSEDLPDDVEFLLLDSKHPLLLPLSSRRSMLMSRRW